MKTRSLINNNGNSVKEVVIIEMKNGDEIMTHCNTPIAGFISGKGYVRTEKFHSVTSSKHINCYVGGAKEGTKVPQEELDALYEAL